jgi:hypothetical protein
MNCSCFSQKITGKLLLIFKTMDGVYSVFYIHKFSVCILVLVDVLHLVQNNSLSAVLKILIFKRNAQWQCGLLKTACFYVYSLNLQNMVCRYDFLAQIVLRRFCSTNVSWLGYG